MKSQLRFSISKDKVLRLGVLWFFFIMACDRPRPNSPNQVSTESEVSDQKSFDAQKTTGAVHIEGQVPEQQSVAPFEKKGSQTQSVFDEPDPAELRNEVSLKSTAKALPQVEPEAFVKSEESLLPSPQEPKTAPKADSKKALSRWLQLGLGWEYFSFSQKASGLSSKLQVGFSQVGAIHASGGLFLSESVGLELGYDYISSRVESSEEISLSAGDYEISRFSSEFLFRSVPSNRAHHRHWIMRMGLQNHKSLFLIPMDVGTLSVTETLILSASLGLNYSLVFQKFRVEGQLRVFYPLTSAVSGGNLDIEPQAFLDGELGASFPLGAGLNFGVYGAARSQKYTFRYSDSEGSFTGASEAMSSLIELRLGAEF